MARPRSRHHNHRVRRRIRQRDVDFLCLAVFGERALPDDMACRIREFREFTMHGLAVAFDRDQQAGRRLEVREAQVEAVAV